MSEWRTIDSALMNEKVLLGWMSGDYWRYSIDEYKREWTLGNCRSGITIHDRATHWMPLLEPPTDATP